MTQSRSRLATARRSSARRRDALFDEIKAKALHSLHR